MAGILYLSTNQNLSNIPSYYLKLFIKKVAASNHTIEQSLWCNTFLEPINVSQKKNDFHVEMINNRDVPGSIMSPGYCLCGVTHNFQRMCELPLFPPTSQKHSRMLHLSSLYLSCKHYVWCGGVFHLISDSLAKKRIHIPCLGHVEHNF